MSDLIDLKYKLQDTHAAIARLRQASAARPEDRRLDLMLESLRLRESSLEDSFRKVANSQQLEICDYRLIPENLGNSLPIAGVGDALKTFQMWLTVVFDAVRNGPKERVRLTPDLVRQSTLEFGYTYSGSLGFMLTIPNERLLFGESELDSAISGMFHMVRSTSSQELSEVAQMYGVGTIRRMYDWARNNASYLVSTDIKWMRADQIRNKTLVQVPEAARLCELIDATSDVKHEEMDLVGELVGGDAVTRIFHMRFPEGEDIRGRMGADFSPSGDLILMRIYKAKILKSTTVHYATDRDDVYYELLHLQGPLN
jgi:hypothetical protein